MDVSLVGPRAIVSGAGYIASRAGHGRVTALKLAEAGALVACVDIDEGRANDIATEIETTGGTAVPVVADMTNRNEVRRAMDEAVGWLGGVDICVDIIGGARWDDGVDVSDDDWVWAIQNNLTQVFYLFQEAGRRMIAQRRPGSLVALASVDGIAAARYHAPYGAAKAGVISLTKTFAQEFGRHGIRVNAVAPGNVIGMADEAQTEDRYGMNVVNPLAEPRAGDIGNAVLFLASQMSARITGQTLVVDGGATIRDVWGLTPERVSMFRE